MQIELVRETLGVDRPLTYKRVLPKHRRRFVLLDCAIVNDDCFMFLGIFICCQVRLDFLFT